MKPEHMGVTRHILPSMRAFTGSEETLARALGKQHVVVNPELQERIMDVDGFVLGPQQRPIIPIAAQGQAVGIEESTFRRIVRTHYVITDLASVCLFNSACSRLEELIDSGSLVPVAATVMSGNDETSLAIDSKSRAKRLNGKTVSTLALSDTCRADTLSSDYSMGIGKIMAVYKRWSFVVRRKDKDEKVQ